MSGPIVSVVIPLYNKRSTLQRTLDSVQNQSFSDFEVIVVDDGSADGGLELVTNLNDPRFRFVTQANAGPGAAKNCGTSKATADLVAFIDADDEWNPTFLETAVSKLTENPECAVFTSDVFLGGKRELTLWSRGRPGTYWEGRYQLDPLADLRQILSAFSSCGVLFRREAVLRYGGFFDQDRCSFGEDVFLWIQILLNHPIYRCTTPLGCYHMEDSELAIGTPIRRYSQPIEPVLLHADIIRRVARLELREWLERWLAWHAMKSAFMQLSKGDTAKCRWLMSRFPKMKRWFLQYMKLRCRLYAPTLYTAVSAKFTEHVPDRP